MKRLHFEWMADGTRVCGLVLAAFFLGARPAEAVVFYSTADPAFNTAAPTGNLAGSGWQFQGMFGTFLGTPIAPNFFVTVGHIGGAVGQDFVFNGVPYPTSAVYDDPNTDLRIWSVCGTFPAYAPLYTSANEVGKGAVVFGRGTQRGDPVTSTNLGVKTHGWLWGVTDNVMRWGENTVTRVINGDPLPVERTVGELLLADFSADAGANECQFSNGDSGGAMFINDGGVWKLAGINYSVSPAYNRAPSGDGFFAAMFDEGGFYTRTAGNQWTFQPDLPSAQPGSFYCIRVSSRVAWINSIISGAAPGSSLILQSAPKVNGPFEDVPDAVVNASARTITLPQPASTRFYRLKSCGQKLIKHVRQNGASLVLEFE